VALISIEQLNDRLGRELAGAEETQALALIDDASALVLEVAAGSGDDPDWTSPGDVPDVIVPVIANMVRRALENPRGLSGEQLGDYQWQAGAGTGQASIYATRREERIIRRAAGRLGVGTVQLEGYLQVESGSSGGTAFEDQLIDSLR